MSPAVIESVEPGSPAAKAGLEGRDTIVAFGSISLPGAVPLADLIKPGERLPLKIRRSGRERTVSVVVGERQVFQGTVNIAGGVRICDDEECSIDISMLPSVRAPRAPAVAGTPPVPAAPPTPTTKSQVFVRAPTWSATDYSIAGAMLTTITDDLEDLTGVDEGILVLRVAPGTPAASSGLRGGDVIVRVNDEVCEGVRDLQQAVQRASSRGARQVALVVSRQRKERPITLQW
jgi:serine protease Do